MSYETTAAHYQGLYTWLDKYGMYIFGFTAQHIAKISPP